MISLNLFKSKYSNNNTIKKYCGGKNKIKEYKNN